jgi:hypothetical protein
LRTAFAAWASLRSRSRRNLRRCSPELVIVHYYQFAGLTPNLWFVGIPLQELGIGTMASDDHLIERYRQLLGAHVGEEIIAR